MTERERADGLMTLGQSVAASPELYPVEFDPSCGRVRLIRLREEDYRAASFLDERLLVRGATETSIDWMEFAAAAEPIPLACDFIFHIGHVGSTLLARLLGTHERVFALREPALLRLLATGPGDDARLETLLRLYSRTWRAPQRSLVKATSFVSQIGPAMLRKAPSSRAVLMTVRAPTYIAGILGGTATRADLPRTVPQRLARLARRIKGGGLPAASSPGELAAAAWITEVWALADIASAFPDRILWLDFDEFLLDPRRGLAAVLLRLLGAAPSRELGPLLASPDMNRYSKAPEHPFGPGARGAALRQSAQVNAAEIGKGRAWLDRLAGSDSAAARIMSEKERLPGG
jgi:hypothetical protein